MANDPNWTKEQKSGLRKKNIRGSADFADQFKPTPASDVPTIGGMGGNFRTKDDYIAERQQEIQATRDKTEGGQQPFGEMLKSAYEGQMAAFKHGPTKQGMLGSMDAMAGGVVGRATNIITTGLRGARVATGAAPAAVTAATAAPAAVPAVTAAANVAQKSPWLRRLVGGGTVAGLGVAAYSQGDQLDSGAAQREANAANATEATTAATAEEPARITDDEADRIEKEAFAAKERAMQPTVAQGVRRVGNTGIYEGAKRKDGSRFFTDNPYEKALTDGNAPLQDIDMGGGTYQNARAAGFSDKNIAARGAGFGDDEAAGMADPAAEWQQRKAAAAGLRRAPIEARAAEADTKWLEAAAASGYGMGGKAPAGAGSRGDMSVKDQLAAERNDILRDRLKFDQGDAQQNREFEANKLSFDAVTENDTLVNKQLADMLKAEGAPRDPMGQLALRARLARENNASPEYQANIDRLIAETVETQGKRNNRWFQPDNTTGAPDSFRQGDLSGVSFRDSNLMPFMGESAAVIPSNDKNIPDLEIVTGNPALDQELRIRGQRQRVNAAPPERKGRDAPRNRGPSAREKAEAEKRKQWDNDYDDVHE